MIIKILKQEPGSYWLCDNVENIHVSIVREFHNQAVGKDDSICKVACSVFLDDDAPKKRETWSIDFKLKGDDTRYTAISDSIAYICNDDGRTVERIVG